MTDSFFGVSTPGYRYRQPSMVARATNFESSAYINCKIDFILNHSKYLSCFLCPRIDDSERNTHLFPTKMRETRRLVVVSIRANYKKKGEIAKTPVFYVKCNNTQ
jgi:hypothetical protein